MGTILASAIIGKAAIITQDNIANVRWPQSELLGWLNDGQREIVVLKPSASVTNVAVQLTANATKQSIPAAGVQLIDVTRNMGSNGATPGNAIRLISREVLDAQVSDWHGAANAGGDIKHYVFDPRDPKTFYVYPKAPATPWYVEIVYSSAPADCASVTSAITVDDIYSNALVNYILHRSYSKDTKYAGNVQLAAAYYSAFANAIGAKAQAESAGNPNATLANGMNPNAS